MLKARTIALTVAAAAVASALLPTGIASGGTRRTPEAGCYNLVSGGGASVKGVISSAQYQNDPTKPNFGSVVNTYYPNALAIESTMAIESTDGAGCAGATYGLLVYPADANGVVTSTTPVHTARVVGASSTTIPLTALVDSYSSDCVALRQQVQDASGYVVDSSPDASMAPPVFCKDGGGAQGFTG